MKDKVWIKPALYAYMAVMTIIITYFASKIWRKELWPNERFTVVVVSAFSFVIVLMALCIKIRDISKLMIIYHSLIILSLVMMLIPYEYRPIMAIFMLLTYAAGLDAGLISALGVSVAVCFLYGAEQEYLYGTLIIGAFSCYVAEFAKNRLKFVIGSIVWIFVSFFINGIFQYYYLNSFNYKFALNSLAAVAISLIVFLNVFFILKPKSVEPFIGEKSDTVKEMKEYSLPLYYHSSEVAELSRAAAQRIGCDDRLAYAGGLLHDIGKLKGKEDYVKSGLKLANEYGMPKEIKSIIVEHDAKYRFPCFKESAIVMLADSVISSIEYLKSSNKEVSESKIIDNVFNMRLSNGSLDRSQLSIMELSAVKKAFLEYCQKSA